VAESRGQTANGLDLCAGPYPGHEPLGVRGETMRFTINSLATPIFAINALLNKQKIVGALLLVDLFHSL
jgi:hypothetical protein